MKGKQKIDRQRGIELNQHRIFRIANEMFYAKVLLYFLKKQFNLPTVFVNICDGFGTQPEMVGKELVMLSSLLIPVANTT